MKTINIIKALFIVIPLSVGVLAHITEVKPIEKNTKETADYQKCENEAACDCPAYLLASKH